jgi:hypothetical protein
MPLPFNPIQLQTYDISQKVQARMFVLQLANMLTQALTPSGLAAVLNNSAALIGALAPGVVTPTQEATSLNDLGSPAGNSTVDTKQASVVTVRVSWTTAANWTLTLNNLAQGAIVYLRLVNSSGAARTFTVAANTPASVAYTVQIFLPANTVLSSPGTSVNNGAGINGFGAAYTSGGSPALHLVGSIG